MPCERAPVISKPALVQRLLGAEQDQPAEDNGLVGFAAPLSMEFVSQLGPVISCNLVFKHHGEPARYGTHLKQHRMPARASKTFCFCRGRCAQHRELRVDAPFFAPLPSLVASSSSPKVKISFRSSEANHARPSKCSFLPRAARGVEDLFVKPHAGRLECPSCKIICSKHSKGFERVFRGEVTVVPCSEKKLSQYLAQ